MITVLKYLVAFIAFATLALGASARLNEHDFNVLGAGQWGALSPVDMAAIGRLRGQSGSPVDLAFSELASAQQRPAGPAHRPQSSTAWRSVVRGDLHPELLAELESDQDSDAAE